MNLELIQKRELKTIAKEIKYFESISSTHLLAKETDFSDGTLLIAEEQTAGIGTKDRKWFTKRGENIAITLVLKPDMKVSSLAGLTYDLADSMKQVLKENYDISVEIKKPNDLILNGKKVSGILVESSSLGEEVKHLWISIGMNVNQMEFEDEIKDIATSLKKETGREFFREDIIFFWLEKVEKLIRKRESK